MNRDIHSLGPVMYRQERDSNLPTYLYTQY